MFSLGTCVFCKCLFDGSHAGKIGETEARWVLTGLDGKAGLGCLFQVKFQSVFCLVIRENIFVFENQGAVSRSEN